MAILRFLQVHGHRVKLHLPTIIPFNNASDRELYTLEARVCSTIVALHEHSSSSDDSSTLMYRISFRKNTLRLAILSAMINLQLRQRLELT